MTVNRGDGTCYEIPDESPIAQAYNALQTAAERIGRANYAAGAYRVMHNRHGDVIRGYSVTQSHKDVVDAMPALLAGKITPEEAMNILHGYDVMKERLAKAGIPSHCL